VEPVRRGHHDDVDVGPAEHGVDTVHDVDPGVLGDRLRPTVVIGRGHCAQPEPLDVGDERRMERAAGEAVAHEPDADRMRRRHQVARFKAPGRSGARTARAQPAR
jgi:hypothetical protein